ncbi:hypothetical protein [Sphingobium sp.]|uniref:hypothetical protein n=1 Tax=Sphingobium sp. TaxID=1912891 RepID=UPI003B3A4BB1
MPTPEESAYHARTSGGRLRGRFTADGAEVSPPLIWSAPPAKTQMLALVVEGRDAPALHPLIHAILWGIDRTEHSLSEGAVARQYRQRLDR